MGKRKPKVINEERRKSNEERKSNIQPSVEKREGEAKERET